jgi:methanogenic corrinoid protein MtbC1
MCDEHPRPIDWVQRLENTLENFDDVGGHRCLSRVFEEMSVEDGLSSVVMPYLHGVGQRWEKGAIGVGQEHFASNVIRARLSAMLQREARAEGPLVVLACLPKEHHEFGLMAAALTFARLGWRTCYLGVSTPMAELVRTCGRLQPDAVVLSAHRQTAYAAHATMLRRLSARASVYIGARGASPSVGDLCRATHLDLDPVAGARLVHSLRAPSEASNVPGVAG